MSDRYLNGIPEDSRIKKDGRFLKENAVDDERLEKIRGLNDIAKKRGQKLSEMALAWLLAKEEVTSVLIGASKPSQIIDNIKATENTEFTEEELKAIDALS